MGYRMGGLDCMKRLRVATGVLNTVLVSTGERGRVWQRRCSYPTECACHHHSGLTVRWESNGPVLVPRSEIKEDDSFMYVSIPSECTHHPCSLVSLLLPTSSPPIIIFLSFLIGLFVSWPTKFNQDHLSRHGCWAILLSVGNSLMYTLRKTMTSYPPIDINCQYFRRAGSMSPSPIHY